MIQTLQTIFPSCISLADSPAFPTSEYRWFLTHDNDMIGIRQEELTEKDWTLLSAFLQRYNTKFPAMTQTEQQWEKVFRQGADVVYPPGSGRYRLIYFSYAVNGLDPVEFNEAIKAIFPGPVSVIWENDHTGTIVEEGNIEHSYEQIADVLMSDLSIKIRFFVGPYLFDRSISKSYYQQMLHDAPITFAYDKHPVLSHLDALPYV